MKDLFRSAAGEVTYTNVNVPRKGQGIVEFADSRGLDYALNNKHGFEMGGRRLTIRDPRYCDSLTQFFKIFMVFCLL